MSCITESGTGSGLKRRMDRRVRRKLWWLFMEVKVSRFDLEDDPLLSCELGPGFVVVTDRKHIDVFICAFCGVADNFAANAEITIGLVRVLNGHRHFWTYFHVPVFHTPFVGVDENVLAIGAEPNGRDLRGAIGHKGCEIE